MIQHIWLKELALSLQVLPKREYLACNPPSCFLRSFSFTMDPPLNIYHSLPWTYITQSDYTLGCYGMVQCDLERTYLATKERNEASNLRGLDSIRSNRSEHSQGRPGRNRPASQHQDFPQRYQEHQELPKRTSYEAYPQAVPSTAFWQHDNRRWASSQICLPGWLIALSGIIATESHSSGRLTRWSLGTCKSGKPDSSCRFDDWSHLIAVSLSVFNLLANVGTPGPLCLIWDSLSCLSFNQAVNLP